MIPSNILDYIKVYENHVPLDLCKAVCKELQEESLWELHRFHSPTDDSYIRFKNELSVTEQEIPTKKEIDKLVWYALERYILKDFADFDGWFGGWTGYQPVRFNRYTEGTEMKVHCDHITTLFEGKRRGVPILTVLGALNDEYEGGEFIMCGDQQIHLPAGSVVVFPSNFMYPHKVNPVKSGVRYSYVSWAW